MGEMTGSRAEGVVATVDEELRKMDDVLMSEAARCNALEDELKRVVAEAEEVHDMVDARKAAAAEQKQALARSQLELVEAKEAAQRAQVELKDGHHELLIASREAADMVNAARKREEELLLRCAPAQPLYRCGSALPYAWIV